MNDLKELSLKFGGLLDAIKSSDSLRGLQRSCELPEPYDDRGYYLFYYAEADYKQALGDIVRFIDGGMRIYYDRRLESGLAQRRAFVAKCKSLHCRLVVFYLSTHAFADETFLELCRTVLRNNIPYVSVNLPENGEIKSGEQAVVETEGIAEGDRELIKKLFANEITYIPYAFSAEEKLSSLEQAHKTPPYRFSVRDGYAVLDYIRDTAETEAVIPERVLIAEKEYVVKAIAPSAFSGCKDLKSITFPDTIETIGVGGANGAFGTANVFFNCKSLQEIVFPPNVKLLGTGCFLGCVSLKRLVLNEGLQFCGNASTMFSMGNALASILEGGEEGDYIADEDVVLDELRLPSSIRRVSKRTYLVNINGWREIKIPNAQSIEGYEVRPLEADYFVERDTDSTFLSGLLRLESVTFSPDRKDEQMFGDLSRCRNLKRATLPPAVKMLTGTFEKCDSLTHVDLPEQLEFIDEDTFLKCVSLEEITIPRNVAFIHKNAFRGCKNLRTLVTESKKSKKLLNSAQPFYQGKPHSFSQALAFACNWIFRFPYLCIRHPVKMRKKLSQKPFWAQTGIQTVYARKKFKIRGFKRCESDREGYYKYVKETEE